MTRIYGSETCNVKTASRRMIIEDNRKIYDMEHVWCKTDRKHTRKCNEKFGFGRNCGGCGKEKLIEMDGSYVEKGKL